MEKIYDGFLMTNKQELSKPVSSYEFLRRLRLPAYYPHAIRFAVVDENRAVAIDENAVRARHPTLQ